MNCAEIAGYSRRPEGRTPGGDSGPAFRPAPGRALPHYVVNSHHGGVGTMSIDEARATWLIQGAASSAPTKPPEGRCLRRPGLPPVAGSITRQIALGTRQQAR